MRFKTLISYNDLFHLNYFARVYMIFQPSRPYNKTNSNSTFSFQVCFYCFYPIYLLFLFQLYYYPLFLLLYTVAIISIISFYRIFITLLFYFPRNLSLLVPARRLMHWFKHVVCVIVCKVQRTCLHVLTFISFSALPFLLFFSFKFQCPIVIFMLKISE